MTGRKWSTERALACVLAAAVALVAVPATGSAGAPESSTSVEDWLLPGIDLRGVRFEAGAWCRYRVVDEAEGVRDTTVVDVSVPIDGAAGDARDGSPAAWWVEFASGAPGTPESERDVLRVLVDADITRRARGDSLAAYVRGYWVRRGGGAAEPGDLAELDRLTLGSDATWNELPDTTVETAAGRFACHRRVRVRRDDRRTPRGRVTVVLRRVDRWTLWLSDDVPLFGLVACRIDRLRESRTEPRVRGIPSTGPRRSRVTTELIAVGRGARSRIEVSP